MKKILFLIFFLNSMKSLSQKTFITFQTGISSSNISKKNFDNNTSQRNTPAYGISYGKNFKKIILETGVTYNPKGFRLDFEYLNESNNYLTLRNKLQYNYNYLSFPLKFGLKSNSKFSPFVKFGILPSIITKSIVSFPKINSSKELEGNESINITQNIKKVDLSGMLDLGVRHDINNTYALLLSYSYQHSFNSFTGNSHFPNLKLFHKSMCLNIGVQYKIE